MDGLKPHNILFHHFLVRTDYELKGFITLDEL